MTWGELDLVDGGMWISTGLLQMSLFVSPQVPTSVRPPTSGESFKGLLHSLTVHNNLLSILPLFFPTENPNSLFLPFHPP